MFNVRIMFRSTCLQSRLKLTYSSQMIIGAQYKAVVEYAPSQRVPRSSTKKDGREGTIYKGNDQFVRRWNKWLFLFCIPYCVV